MERSSGSTRPTAPAVPAGPGLAGRYRLIEPVGAGGMGTVWKARDELLGRTVALKRLRPDAEDPAAARRFEAEARAAAAISHPNVITVFDFGRESCPGGGERPFLVMEFVAGPSLSQVLAERGTLPPAQVLALLTQAALGLAAAHALGVVHRDVKPSNLLFGPHGRVKVTDFGIARTPFDPALTRTGAVVGTAAYLSPEQAEGSGATPASDLYSLGVVAYACLAGHPPFIRDSEVATLLAHVRDPLPPLPPGTPAGLATLVADLLAKRPAGRPASAAEVAARAAALAQPAAPEAAALAQPAPAEAGTAVLPAAGGTAVLPAAGGTAVLRRSEEAPSRSRPAVGPAGRRHWRLVAGGLAAGAMAVVAILALGGSGPPARVSVPSVVGDRLAGARAALRRAGLLDVSTRSVDSPGHPAGAVVAQSPAPGTRLSRNGPVTLTVASGLVDVPASSYVGLPYSTVAGDLSALGLHAAETTSATPAVSAGTVLSVSPSGPVAEGSSVQVVVATTPTTATTAGPPPPSQPGKGKGKGDQGPGPPGPGNH